MKKYRFIVENTDNLQAHVLDAEKVSNMKLKFKKESEEEYVRIFPSGEITITNKEDYNWLMEYEGNAIQRCSKFLFHLELFCSGTYVRYQTFKFSLNNSKPCLDTCEISISLQIDDIYQCLKDGDQQRNILKTGDLPEKTVDSYPDFSNLEFYIMPTTDASCNNTSSKPPIEGNSYGLFGCSNGTLGSAGSGCQLIYAKVWARRVIKRTCVAGVPLSLPAGAILISNDCGLNGTYTFAQPYVGSSAFYNFGNTTASGEPFYFSSHADLGHICESDPITTAPYSFLNSQNITTLCSDPGYPDINADLRYCFYIDRVKLETLTPKISYTRCRDYADTLLWLANQSCPSINCISSEFLNKNVLNAGATNYVTGEKNKLDQLVVLEKSDAVLPNSTEKATILNLTFKQLYETLKKTTNSRFTIDKDGCIIIEHISKLKEDKNIVLDLSNDKFIEGLCCYEYDTSQIPKIENWKMQEASGLDFIGEPIEYKLSNGEVNPCATAEQKSVDISELTTDLEFVQETLEEKQSLDGFMLLSNEDDGLGGRKVTSEEGKLTATTVLNGHMSISNLQDAYHCHNRPILIGVMNTIYREFCSETKKKKGQEIEIPFCCTDLLNFNPNGLVKTKFGNGDIEEGEYDLLNETLSLNLIY
jgi:hypothetical protein